jgi:hypothetical protein
MHWNGKLVPDFENKPAFPVFMSVTSALTFEAATRPHNTQESSSSAFLSGLTCAQKHRLINDAHIRRFAVRGKAAERIIADFKNDVPTALTYDPKTQALTGADPYAFLDYMFESVGRIPLGTPQEVTCALERAKKQPCILPLLPVNRKRWVDVVSRNELLEQFRDVYSLPPADRVWHSQCVVGAAWDGTRHYFVCLQSWRECLLTFVEAASYEEFVSESNKHLRVPTKEELHLEHRWEMVFPKTLKTKHAPSPAQFNATKAAGMIVPPVYTGYLQTAQMVF